MITPINMFTPYGYNVNFRSDNANILGFNFQPKLRPQLSVDVFEKVASGGINSSKKTTTLADELFPYAKIKSLCPDAREAERNKKIDKEKIHISNPVTKRTEYNTKQLRAAGVPERDVKKYLTYDGHVNAEGKHILREHGKSYQ